MWGQASAKATLATGYGIIPTRVGTRKNHERINEMDKDHPHACGDKVLHGRTGIKCVGSSPRVWGQDSYRSRNQKRSRIIPTRVGTRSFLDNRKSWNKDHPHACGDKVQYQTWFLLLSGSSPRVWGQGSASLEKLFKIGIIPTRVGTRRQGYYHTHNI